MSYLQSGQFRRVEGTDNGCARWQCMWCKQMMELRDDPEMSRWNFCPMCGKSWFTKLECRLHWVPRWAYEKWGNRPPYEANIHCHKNHEATAIWVIEWRSDFMGGWGDWTLEIECEKDPCKPDYLWVYSILQQKRADRQFGVNYEYRFRLIQKKDLTFTFPGVQLGQMTEEQKLIRNLYQKYCHGK